MTAAPGVVAPRPASTLCLFRSGTSSVLMVQRGSTARFMASAWVFPGGTVDEADHDLGALGVVGVEDPEAGPWVAAAVRELVEEVGIWLGGRPLVDRRPEWIGPAVYRAARAMGRSLGGERLALFANWITPEGFPMRFDTRFFVATVDSDLDPDPDPRELDDARWVDVDEALAAARAGKMTIPFPTLRTLEQVAVFDHGDALVEHARALDDVPAVLPKVRRDGDGAMSIVLPTDADYDRIEQLGAGDASGFARLAESARRGGRRVEGRP
jgi:8-oxo-dGTP pyrophosphatase MutT (NUDIX family)